MKVTKHEITKAYHVVLHCDRCDSIMKFNGFDYKAKEYKSICPNCGNEVFTGDIAYPYTIYDWANEPIEEKEV